jgi:hypothetical protein
MAFLWQRSADPLAFASVKAAWKRAQRNWPHAGFMIAVAGITLSGGILSYFRLFRTMAPRIMAIAAFLSLRPAASPLVLGLFAIVNGAMMVSRTLGLGIYRNKNAGRMARRSFFRLAVRLFGGRA